MIITNNATYSRYHNQRPSLNRQKVQNNNVNFNGGLLAATLVCGSIFTLLNGINLKPMLQENKTQVATTSKWEPNVRVMSSVGQNVITIGTDSVEYTSRLMDQLDSNKVSTIEQANETLSKSGYMVDYSKKNHGSLNNAAGFISTTLFSDIAGSRKRFYPLQTPGEQLGMFNKNEPNKQRFILIFHQDGVPLAKTISNNFSKKLRETYKIEDGDMIWQGINSTKDFQSGVEYIQKRINRLKDKDNAELLIFYAGHGEAKSLTDSATEIEGAMEGRLKTKSKIEESEVKKLFQENLHDIKTLFIIDACNSGSWIADNAKTAAKKLRIQA